jgi:hypothetical protein
MGINDPLICDYVIKAAGGSVEQEVRFDHIPASPPFDHIPASPPSITAEVLIGVPTVETFTVEEWRRAFELQATFVERAFDIRRARWDKDLESDLEFKYDLSGTQFVFEALMPPPQSFERTVDIVTIDGEIFVQVQPYMASDPITINTWHVFYKGVDSLIEQNIPGGTSRGL